MNMINYDISFLCSLKDCPSFSGDCMTLDFLTKPEKLNLLKALASDPEIKTEVRTWFDEMLITSELRPIQRTAKLEELTGCKTLTWRTLFNQVVEAC